MKLLVKLLLTLLATTFALAQETTAPFGEEIEVRVIDVDVAVTDRQGNPLTDLKREDFELYENGKRVEIAYFSRIVGGRIADLPAPPPAAEGATADTAPAVAPRTPLSWIVYIDQASIAPQRRNQAMRQLQIFLQSAVTGGDRALLALNDGRSFRVRQGLTDDPKLLLETLTKIEKERIALPPGRMRANQILNELRRVDNGDPELQYIAQNIAGDIESVMNEEALRTRNSIRAMGSMLEALTRLEGRIALVYVGAGFNTLPAADLVATWRSRFSMLGPTSFEPRPEEHRDPIQREITGLYTNLSAQRVTVYTIHGGDAGGGPTSVEDSGQIETHIDSSTDITALTEAGLAREMAQRTGGLYFKVNQQLASQMEAVRRDLANYYSLGYKPTGDPTKARRVSVKVNVPGARVRHRQNVRERTRTELAAGEVIAATVQPRVAQKMQQQGPVVPAAVTSAANPLGINVQAARPRLEAGGAHRLPFDFAIQLEALTFVQRPNNVHRADFVMHFALVGRNGAVYPLESRDQSLSVPSAELGPADQHVSYSWHVDLAPLKIPQDVPVKEEGMRLTVTVEDRTSGVRSVVTVPVGEAKAEKRG